MPDEQFFASYASSGSLAWIEEERFDRRVEAAMIPIRQRVRQETSFLVATGFAVSLLASYSCS